MPDLRIQLERPEDVGVIHRFKNFGEEVYREFCDTWTVSLEEIDAASSSFLVRDIKRRQLSRTRKRLTELIDKHGFKGLIEVDVEE